MYCFPTTWNKLWNFWWSPSFSLLKNHLQFFNLKKEVFLTPINPHHESVAIEIKRNLFIFIWKCDLPMYFWKIFICTFWFTSSMRNRFCQKSNGKETLGEVKACSWSFLKVQQSFPSKKQNNYIQPHKSWLFSLTRNISVYFLSPLVIGFAIINSNICNICTLSNIWLLWDWETMPLAKLSHGVMEWHV